MASGFSKPPATCTRRPTIAPAICASGTGNAGRARNEIRPASSVISRTSEKWRTASPPPMSSTPSGTVSATPYPFGAGKRPISRHARVTGAQIEREHAVTPDFPAAVPWHHAVWKICSTAGEEMAVGHSREGAREPVRIWRAGQETTCDVAAQALIATASAPATRGDGVRHRAYCMGRRGFRRSTACHLVAMRSRPSVSHSSVRRANAIPSYAD